MRERRTNVLILGSGAREHALARACSKSASIGNLFVAPGNPGCATVAHTAPISLAEHAKVIAFCQREAIDMVVVGPEAPLVSGLADDLIHAGISCFGPTRDAARLEGSKGYAKDFCREFGIPTGDFRRFRDPNEAKTYIRMRGAPIVVKADGLAAGKGVVVARTIEEADVAVDTFLPDAWAYSRAEVVIEEFLEGEEVSFLRPMRRRNSDTFSSAQDHKRVGEGDKGPEYWRYGRLFSAYGNDPEIKPAHNDRDCGPDIARNERTRLALSRVAICRFDGRRTRAKGD